MIATDPGMIIYPRTVSRDTMISFGEWVDVLEGGSGPLPLSEFQRIKTGYPKTLFPSDGKPLTPTSPWSSSEKSSCIALK